MKTLYFECTSGISGDMTVASLLDLGADENVLRRGLESLNVDGYRIEISRVNKSGIDACDFRVILEQDEEEHSHPREDPHGDHSHGDDVGHSHDHAHSHGADHEHDHGHPHSHAHMHDRDVYMHSHSHEHSDGNEHAHGHGHPHEHGHAGHIHRNVIDIKKLIEASAISQNAKNMAAGIFDVVAKAEAKVHGKPLEEVHFHEVGAVDSIVDIVGAAICVDNLGVDRVICSPLREGTGTVKCQHGIMPVPAPATLEIIRNHNIPLIITENKGEMVTPTGAAIVAALASCFNAPRDVLVKKIGYGAGKRNYQTANVVRAMLLEECAGTHGEVLKIECNLDDMTGEELSYACGKLLEAGALDVWTAPIFMKKGRPGQMLSVLCEISHEDEMTELTFKHTTTIGVRLSRHRRNVMERSQRTVVTEHGPVEIKESSYKGICKSKPEFDCISMLSDEKNLSVTQLSRLAYNEGK